MKRKVGIGNYMNNFKIVVIEIGVGIIIWVAHANAKING